MIAKTYPIKNRIRRAITYLVAIWRRLTSHTHPHLRTFLGELAKGTALCAMIVLLWILCALI